MSEYTVDYAISTTDDNVHSEWDRTLEPVLSVKPGDTITFECRDAWDALIDEDTTAEEVPEALEKREGGMPITAPWLSRTHRQEMY